MCRALCPTCHFLYLPLAHHGTAVQLCSLAFPTPHSSRTSTIMQLLYIKSEARLVDAVLWCFDCHELRNSAALKTSCVTRGARKSLQLKPLESASTAEMCHVEDEASSDSSNTILRTELLQWEERKNSCRKDSCFGFFRSHLRKQKYEYFVIKRQSRFT